MTKTVVGLFDNVMDAQAAIRELTDNGIPRSNVSVMSHAATDAATEGTAEGQRTAVGEGAVAGAGVGAALGGIGGLVVGLGALTIPGIGPLLAAGPLVAALTGAGIGAGVGALVGALVGMGVPEEQAGYYAEGIRRGGTLVTVAAPDDMLDRATDILNNHNPVDIKRRSEDWRGAGWKGYDPNAKPYTRDEMEAERERWTTTRSQGPMTGTGFRSSTGTTGTGTHSARDTTTEDTRATSRTTDTGAYKAPDMTARVGDRLSDEDDEEAHFLEIEAKPGEGYDAERYLIYDVIFRSDFDRRYADRGYTYDRYIPVYHYAHYLATAPRFTDKTDWYDIETEARVRWEDSNPGTWEEIKDTVREAWQNIKEKAR